MGYRFFQRFPGKGGRFGLTTLAIPGNFAFYNANKKLTCPFESMQQHICPFTSPKIASCSPFPKKISHSRATIFPGGSPIQSNTVLKLVGHEHHA